MHLAGQEGDAPTLPCSLRSGQRNGAAAEDGRRPSLLRNSRRCRPLLPLTTFSRAAGITELKASRHGGFPEPQLGPFARPSSLGGPSMPLPPPFMPIKQPIDPSLHGGQCTVQRKQHVEEYTAEGTRLCKTQVRARRVSHVC